MDTFKLADEVRAENRGEVWDAEKLEAVPAPKITEETPVLDAPIVDAPVDAPIEIKVEDSNTITK